MLHDAAAQQRPVIAIALLVGGNDFLNLSDPASGVACYVSATQTCVELFTDALSTYSSRLDTIVSQVDQAKDTGTPLFMLNQYNPFDTGADTPQSRVIEAALGAVNDTIAAAATAHGAYLVDIHSPFRGRAASLVRGVDPSLEGHRVIATALEQAYAAWRLSATAATTPTAPAPPALPSTGTGPTGATSQVALVWLLASRRCPRSNRDDAGRVRRTCVRPAISSRVSRLAHQVVDVKQFSGGSSDPLDRIRDRSIITCVPRRWCRVRAETSSREGVVSTQP